MKGLVWWSNYIEGTQYRGESIEQRAESREERAERRKQRAESREQRAERVCVPSQGPGWVCCLFWRNSIGNY
jgi:hypothetical protein